MDCSILKITLENNHFNRTDVGMGRAFVAAEEEENLTIPHHAAETGSS